MSGAYWASYATATTPSQPQQPIVFREVEVLPSRTPIGGPRDAAEADSAPTPEQRTLPPTQPTQQPAAPTTSSITGTATWYCLAGVSRCTRTAQNGLYAAISPDLDFLRGKAISVCYGASCVTVEVIDCNCSAHRSIDLYADAFRMLAPLSAGRIKVTISWK